MSVSTQKIEKSRYGKRYYIANRERMLARTKQWKLDNPEKHNAGYLQRYCSVEGRAKVLFKSAQKRAIERGHEFSIDLDWIKARLEKGVCEITGLAFVFSPESKGSRGRRGAYAPSLDRRDSSKGYTKENCRIILWALNMSFADWGQDEFLKIARRLIEWDM